VVQVRKLLRRIHSGEISAEVLEDTMREAYFIPAGTSLLSQMQLFQENQRRTGLWWTSTVNCSAW